MDMQRVRARLPILVALFFFVIAFSRPAQRGAWLAIGIVFLVIGLRRRKAAPPPDRSSGV